MTMFTHRRRFPLLLLGHFLFIVSSLTAQQSMGRIIGQVRVAKGDFPSQPILVELQLRGSTMNSVYTDDQGRFGFYNLEANPYHVMIHDPAFRDVDELANVNPLVATFNMVQIQLDAKEDEKQLSPAGPKAGSNPYMINTADYNRNFPKGALKEFDRGVKSDRAGKRDDAIQHYEKAVKIAPAFYMAHNNLGSAYLSKADLASARKEFEAASTLNQSDAAAYFNLSNVCMLMGSLPDSQRYLEEGKRRQPDSPFAPFLEGTLNFRAGRLPQAEALLRRAIELSPVMAQAYLQLVNVFLQQGRKGDAVAELQNFVEAFPDGQYSDQAKGLLKKLQSNDRAVQR
jgi:tetratricopeptide (TPR) repeat protein